jgi:hypothetical protein
VRIFYHIHLIIYSGSAIKGAEQFMARKEYVKDEKT